MKENKRISYVWYALALVLIIAAGRVTMTVYNNVSVDISYAPWFANLFQYAADGLNGAKIALGFGAVAYAVHHVSKKAGTITMFLYLGGLLLENAARFLIDYFSSGLAYYGIPLTLMALGSRFLYEAIFVLAAWLIARIFLKRANSAAEDEKTAKTGKKSFFSGENSTVLAILLLMAAQIVGEIGYLAEHISIYGELTAEDLSVCIGSFLYIIVMYGGIPLLCKEWVFPFMRRITHES